MSATLLPLRGRSAGLLLHPVSLPGPFGIGDLGLPAFDWVKALARARLSWWQVLPLGPTGYADSPYQSLSSHAGNTNLISPDGLLADGLVRRADLDSGGFTENPINYEAVIPFKRNLLRLAWERFSQGSSPSLRPE